MSEELSPRVRVTLSNDVPARLRRWRQDKAGAWWAEVELYAPAAAVQQVAGEDYADVPREPAGPRYVLATDTRVTPPTMELHLATCWEFSQPAAWRRITPVSGSQEARTALRFDDTTPCPVCTPTP